jgi:FixJ family two-component response regulator
LETRLISIVDDDDHARSAIQFLVQSLGHTALTFPSAEKFLRSGLAAKTVCLITDVQMPDMTGLELRDRLLAEGHETPVIFITAYPERFRERALEHKVLGFLGKPFRAESLIDCLTAALAEAMTVPRVLST